MQFIIGAEKLEDNVMNIYFQEVMNLTRVHVAVVHFKKSEHKWNPIGAWQMLNVLSTLVGLTEQQLLFRLHKEKQITFKLNAEETK